MGALLQLGVLQLALRLAVDNGFIPMIPPVLVRPEVMGGTGFLGAHADEVYRVEADDLYLVGTSEVPLAGYHADEILDEFRDLADSKITLTSGGLELARTMLEESLGEQKASEILDRVTAEGTAPSDEDLAALRGWGGWGPMAPAFAPGRGGAWREIGGRPSAPSILRA